MLGLALEGGGARGAFHIGAVKALLEHGYEFDGVVGTSIGAFNAALICQGDFKLAYNLWINMDPSTLFNIEDEYMKKIINTEINKDTIKYISNKTRDIIGNRGIDTTKLRMVLDENVFEEKIRNSKLDFGIVTVSISELKPIEVYKEDIPVGMINDYIMASGSFPGFKLNPIDGKYYIDGGIHDNCPVSLLARKGYKDIIAVRTTNNYKTRKYPNKEINVINIVPSENLGKVLIFNNDVIRKNIRLGYFDTLKVLNKLVGSKYYIKHDNDINFMNIFDKLDKEAIYQMGDILKISKMDSKRMLFEKILPAIADLLKQDSYSSYEDIFIGLLEILAMNKGLNRFKVYNIHEFINEIDKSYPIENIEGRKRSQVKKIKMIATNRFGTNKLDDLAYIVLEYVLANDLVLIEKSYTR